MVKPIFIVSLPRAGSTLLQRLLMGHPSIDSCGEPWLALPLVYMLEKDGVVAEYGHRSAATSIRQFVDGLPDGEDTFWKHSAEFLTALYADHTTKEGATHFVDKTPRYYKILGPLEKIYPLAPVIVLIRNPLSIFASMLNFVEGDLRYMPMWKNDWLEGHEKIALALAADGLYKVVRYESLITKPEESVSRLMGELGMAYDPRQLDQLSEQRLKRGDPTGVKKYNEVDQSPLSSWKASIDTSTKKRMAMKWLGELPDEVWAAMAYKKDLVLEELQNHIPSKRWSLRESAAYCLGRIYFQSGLHFYTRMIKKNSDGRRPFYN